MLRNNSQQVSAQVGNISSHFDSFIKPNLKDPSADLAPSRIWWKVLEAGNSFHYSVIDGASYLVFKNNHLYKKYYGKRFL